MISQDTSAYGVDRKHDTSALERSRRARPHHRPRARTGQARRLGAAALRLPLPACPRPDPADGRRAGAALSRHPVPARPPRHAAPHGPARRRRQDAGRNRRLARVSAPTSPCAPPSSSAIPARPRPNSRPCWTGWTRRNSTGSAASSTKTSPARGRTPCPTMSPTKSSRTAGIASWKKRAGDFRGEAGRKGRHSARGRSSTRSTTTAPPAAPRPTRPRSTATSSSTKGSRR